MKKTTIFLISGKNPLSYAGGYATYSKSLASNLTKLKFKVEIFCVGDNSSIQKTSIGTINTVGNKFLSSIFNNVEMAGLIIYAPILALAILKKLDGEKTNLIWGVGPWGLGGLICKLNPKFRVKLYCDYFTTVNHEFNGTLQAVNFEDYGLLVVKNKLIEYLLIKPYSLLERLLLKNSDKIIVHYNSTKTIISKEMNINQKRFIHLPYSLSYFNKIELKRTFDSKIPKLLLISRHDGRKGINYLLHALKMLENRGIEYEAVIAGGGQMFEQNKELHHRLKIENVKLIGKIDNKNDLLKTFDYFVFPSVEEGSGSLSILEAMSYGMAIVSTNVDGLSEDLANGYSALLVPPKDPKELADAMEKLINNPKLAVKLGQNAKKEYLKNHNPENVKKEIGKLIWDIVN